MLYNTYEQLLICSYKVEGDPNEFDRFVSGYS